jgi:hypothetical protein
MSTNKIYSPVIEPKKEEYFKFFDQKIKNNSIKWKKEADFAINKMSADVRFFGTEDGQRYAFILHLRISSNKEKNNFSMVANLFLKTASVIKIATWNVKNVSNLDDIKDSLYFLDKNSLKLPFEADYSKKTISLAGKDDSGRNMYNYIRLTRQKGAWNASQIEFYILKDEKFSEEYGYIPVFKTKDLETNDGQNEPMAIAFNNKGEMYFNADQAVDILNTNIENAKSKKAYVDNSSSSYIPKGSNFRKLEF